jgi:hypothetical protein
MLNQKTKAKLATRSAKGVGRTALEVSKAQTRLARQAIRSREEPTSIRILKYGLAFLVGFIGGTIVGRTRSGRYAMSFVEATTAKREISDTSSTTDTTSDS